MKPWVLLMALIAGAAGAEEPVRLFAAGSLREVVTALAAGFGPPAIEATFGASGLLRERLSRGEPADVFASANLEHPLSLHNAGRSGPVERFARNNLCILARHGLPVDQANVLDRMLDPALKLGTSTPKADPSGDYAWQLFERAEKLRPGSFSVLDRKALKLTGGPASPPPPSGRSVYALLVANGDADLFVTYCTNAVAARRENASLQVVALPGALAVGADYGITEMHGARSAGRRFVRFVLSRPGQEILAQHGFWPAR
jgi:ABC-type molybdate transport system substrate-binding protein